LFKDFGRNSVEAHKSSPLAGFGVTIVDVECEVASEEFKLSTGSFAPLLVVQDVFPVNTNFRETDNIYFQCSDVLI
jgi:hypothetical protein